MSIPRKSLDGPIVSLDFDSAPVHHGDVLLTKSSHLSPLATPPPLLIVGWTAGRPGLAGAHIIVVVIQTIPD